MRKERKGGRKAPGGRDSTLLRTETAEEISRSQPFSVEKGPSPPHERENGYGMKGRINTLPQVPTLKMKVRIGVGSSQGIRMRASEGGGGVRPTT